MTRLASVGGLTVGPDGGGVRGAVGLGSADGCNVGGGSGMGTGAGGVAGIGAGAGGATGVG